MGAYQSSAKRNGARTTSSNLELVNTAVSNGAVNGNGLAAGELIPVVQDCRLRKVLQMIASDSPQKIQDLALECNLSESHLQHLFKDPPVWVWDGCWPIKECSARPNYLGKPISASRRLHGPLAMNIHQVLLARLNVISAKPHDASGNDRSI